MQLFRQIKDSIYNPSFYASLRSQPFSYSLKFYIKFFLLLAILGVVIGAVLIFPHVWGVVGDGLQQEVVNKYPAELVVTLANGQVSINQPEPYKIGTGIVIDTQTSFTPEQFESYGGKLWVMKTSAALKDKNNGVRIVPLKEVPNVSIDQAFIQKWAGKLKPLLIAALLLGIPFGILMALLFLGVWYLLTLLVAATLIWGIGKATSWQLSWGKSYQMSIHAMVLPLLLLAIFIAFQLPTFPFAFTLLVCICAYLNLRSVAVPLSA